jgi:hypothetical protein
VNAPSPSELSAILRVVSRQCPTNGYSPLCHDLQVTFGADGCVERVGYSRDAVTPEEAGSLAAFAACIERQLGSRRYPCAARSSQHYYESCTD